MKGRMTTVLDTNIFGGPFGKLYEIQRWVEKHDYSPDEWDFTEATKQNLRNDPEELKAAIDNREHTVPCGARIFTKDSVKTHSRLIESTGNVEVDVTATCTECGFQFTDISVLTPRE